MRIVAITKTFRGEEWAADSLRSIYDFCSRIVYVHSERAWNGDVGNTVREIVKAVPDPKDKVIHLDVEGNQNEQYNAAVRYLFENEIKYDYLMLIDTDEVWDAAELEKARAMLERNQNENSPAMAIRTQMYDYIKSPFFRIDPPSQLKPVVFVHHDAVKLNSINVRGSDIVPCKILGDVFFHHFCSVRKSLMDVWQKHSSSCSIESEPIFERDIWVKNIWNRLPSAKNCCPLKKLPQYWAGAKKVTLDDLPAEVHNNPIVKAWIKYPDLVCTVKPNHNPSDLQKVGLPPDFGPDHPDWNMPSKRVRYERLLGLTK